MAAGPNFYTQLTYVNEKYTNNGREESVDLPLVTLPAGTVLFRGMRLPHASASASAEAVDYRLFYRDFLGDPEGPNVCLTPTHNTFFYPFPHIAFGTADVGDKFDVIQVFVLVHPITVVCSIRPSQWVRGVAKRYQGNAPYQRCSTVPAVTCHTLSEKELDAASYDNCLNPEYQVKSGVRGWMALAERDSLNKRDSAAGAALNPMATYVKALDARKPGIGTELAAWSYIDSRNVVGFPEIALYPYHKHPGNRVNKRRCNSHEAAMKIMQQEAEADNLNYLPIATITKDFTIDMVNGLFTYERLGVSANSFSIPATQQQPAIETRVQEYIDALQTKGIKLPLYGNGVMSFDTRTGFYVLPQIIPRKFMIKENIPYRYLTLPLSTPEEKKKVMDYILIFRTFKEDKFLETFGLYKGIGIRRAMIFNRPPDMRIVFKGLDMGIPENYVEALKRASTLFQKESGKNRGLTAADANADAKAGPTTPPEPQPYPEYWPEGVPKSDSITPPASSFVASPPGPRTPSGTPPSRTPPLNGGTRKKINKRSNTKKTKKSKKTICQLAQSFSKIWAAFKK
jgi:hypothetical protein